MKVFFKFIFNLICILALSWIISSCSNYDEEPLRTPKDIEGIWSPDDTQYFEFGSNNNVRYLSIVYQDGETIGDWVENAYFYEPGYNFVIYMNADHNAMVYQIIELTDKNLTWCWVKELEIENRDDISKAIGEVIKEAQEGFNLNPELYESFEKISEDEFLSVLEKLDLMYPW